MKQKETEKNTSEMGTEFAKSNDEQVEARMQKSNGGELMNCVHCKKEIRQGERRYLSRQAGMKGMYHWDCFVNACRQANKVGAQEIETIAVSAGVYDNFNSFDVVDE